MGRGKYFDLSDLPKFARPNVIDIDAAATAREVAARLGDGGFMSYGPLWPRLRNVFNGTATDAFIELQFSQYKDEWKNGNLREAFLLLRDYFGGKGTWYPVSGRPIFVLGFWFRPTIKGIWFVDGQAYAVAINARKWQPFSSNDVRFIARGVHELHCVDDVNDPIPLIIDLAAERAAGRRLRAYSVCVEDAVSLEAFEHSVREFLVAMNSVGLAQPLPPDIDDVVGLFRR